MKGDRALVDWVAGCDEVGRCTTSEGDEPNVSHRHPAITTTMASAAMSIHNLRRSARAPYGARSPVLFPDGGRHAQPMRYCSIPELVNVGLGYGWGYLILRECPGDHLGCEKGLLFFDGCTR